jgi:hypothetical protein
MEMMAEWRTDGGFEGGLWSRNFAPAEFVHRYPCSKIHFFPQLIPSTENDPFPAKTVQ